MNNTPDNTSENTPDNVQNSTPNECEDGIVAVPKNTKRLKTRLDAALMPPAVLRFFAIFFAVAAAVSLCLRVIFEFFPSAAELFYRYVTVHLQGFSAFLTSFLPFSLAETAILLLLPFAVLVLSLYISALIKKDIRKRRSIGCIITIISCYVLTSYLLCLSILYCRPSLSTLSGIENNPVSSEELRTALDVMADGIKKCERDGEIVFGSDGCSICPYSFDELSDKIDTAFNRYAKENPWLSPYSASAKQIALSNLMTYTHLSGIYTPYTGEANVNVNYPDFVVVASMAHEKAHQRGIAPENEANVLAMIVLCESGDPYLEYCGYMSVFNDILGAYLLADQSGWSDYIRTTLPMIAVYELDAYSAFFDKYRESPAATAADAINNSYLKANGEHHGVRSYGMVVNMVARYFGGMRNAYITMHNA